MSPFPRLLSLSKVNGCNERESLRKRYDDLCLIQLRYRPTDNDVPPPTKPRLYALVKKHGFFRNIFIENFLLETETPPKNFKSEWCSASQNKRIPIALFYVQFGNNFLLLKGLKLYNKYIIIRNWYIHTAAFSLEWEKLIFQIVQLYVTFLLYIRYHNLH